MTDYMPPETGIPPQEPPPPPPPPFEDKASGMAIASFVLGLLGTFCCFSVLAGIPAIVVGFMEKNKIRDNVSSPRGFGFAIAGIVLGFFSVAQLILGIIYLIFVFAAIGGGGKLLESLQ